MSIIHYVRNNQYINMRSTKYNFIFLKIILLIIMILILIYFCVVASLFIFSLPSFSDTTDWMMLDSNDYYENIESSKNEETTYMLTESDSSDKEKDRKINDVNTIN